MKIRDFWIRRAGGPDLPRRCVRQTKRCNHWMVCILREKIFFSFPFQLPRGAMWCGVRKSRKSWKNIRVVAGHLGGTKEKQKKQGKNRRRRPRGHQQQLERQTLSSWWSSHILSKTSRGWRNDRLCYDHFYNGQMTPNDACMMKFTIRKWAQTTKNDAFSLPIFASTRYKHTKNVRRWIEFSSILSRFSGSYSF